MNANIKLPQQDRTFREYTLREPPVFAKPGRVEKRTVYAAAHVVADPLAANSIGAPAQLDWDATLAFRRHLWSLGLGVAEAMDTAQRGMGLDWAVTKELIQRSAAEARQNRFPIACGAGTDQLAEGGKHSLETIVDAYLEQCELVETAGARPILMASRALAATARDADDYERVYSSILAGVSGPVILHWLGAMFDPVLRGYWGSENLDDAGEICLKIIENHAAKIDGIKVSLLDKAFEIQFRQRLPRGVKLYTGDDFNYPELILGDATGYSDALLGIFDGIAPAAAAALGALDQGDGALFSQILEPTIPLSRHIFCAPTYYYKTGLTFLAYINGYQNHFRMVGGLESFRSVIHLCNLFILADRAGVIRDPELAIRRMRPFLAVSGAGV
ncbi:MAG TPA: dihydrodipicolinate synthase family protein [Chthoniobacterales bacterium]|nr:dihydrodipicolinate synthase family protein [Chthoniobacterales bacterium]